MRTASLILGMMLAACGGQMTETDSEPKVVELDPFVGHYTSTHGATQLRSVEIVKLGDAYAFRGTPYDDIRFTRVNPRTLESGDALIHRIHLAESGPEKVVLRVLFCYMEVELHRSPIHLAMG